MRRVRTPKAYAGAWIVYMIQSATGRFYTGITTDPLRRVREHNGELRGGAKATRAGRPWSLVYTEPFENKGNALRREAAIKKLSHAKKAALQAALGVWCIGG